MSASGFYVWHQRRPSQRAIGNAAQVERIRTIHAEWDGPYGRARIRAEVIDQGVKVSSKRVARLMRLAGLRGVSQRRGFFVTTWRDPGLGEKAHATCAFFEVLGVEIGYCKATDQQTITWL